MTLKNRLLKFFSKFFFSRCCDDAEKQIDKEQQIFKRFKIKSKIPRIPITESTLTSAHITATASGLGVPGASSFQQTSTTFIKRHTPVLFCTNRGLHLRVAKISSATSSDSLDDSEKPTAFYDIRFCDLERWSTNRAHTVSLQDTIARTLETVEKHPSSSSSKLYLPTRNLGFSQCCNGNLMNGFTPVECSLYYDRSYSYLGTATGK